MNLILLREADVDGADVATLTGARAHHIVEVLRSSPGDALRIGRLNGPLGHGEVLIVARDRVVLRCRFDPAPPARPGIDLLLALPRPKVLKRLWAQLAALGVRRILLSNAARVERDYFDTHVLEPATYEPLLVEGLQQAQDTWMPAVTVHKRFRILIEDELDALTPRDAVRLVAQANPAPIPARLPARTSSAILAIGPESGWTTFELDLLERHHFQRLSLGARTLRTDTACIAILSSVHDALRGAAHTDRPY